MNRAILDLWVGAFVALGFAALMFLAMQVANVSEEGTRGETITLRARFEDIGGLKVKAPVKSAGVVVGMTTTARVPSLCALIATPWAWLPADAQITPRLSCSVLRWTILL